MKDYYTWQNEKDSIEQRTEKINDYLTEELQALNVDPVRNDIPTSSSVGNINIWSVSQENEDTYAVVYSVEQKVTEDKNSEWIRSTYRILLHQDKLGNLVITQNPTLWSLPNKSEPQQPDSNGTVDSDTVQEVTEFLETFFAFYPTATDKELAYYLQDSTLGEAQDLNYDPHDSCTESELESEKNSLFISLLKDIGILNEKWDNW